MKRVDVAAYDNVWLNFLRYVLPVCVCAYVFVLRSLCVRGMVVQFNSVSESGIELGEKEKKTLNPLMPSTVFPDWIGDITEKPRGRKQSQAGAVSVYQT